jgi:hypothetical protein
MNTFHPIFLDLDQPKIVEATVYQSERALAAHT